MPAIYPTSQLIQADAQLLQLVDAAFADSARRAGEHLVCRPGCTQCCHGAFAIDALDALRLRAGMEVLAATNPALAAAIQQRALKYLEEFGPSFPGNPLTGLLGESEDAQSAFTDFANEAPCPALDPETGLCGVYPWRPMTCRVFGPPVRTGPEEQTGQEEPNQSESGSEAAFAVCELCFTQAAPEEIAAAEMHVPHREEERLLNHVQSATDSSGQTIVAYCLVPQSSLAIQLR